MWKSVGVAFCLFFIAFFGNIVTAQGLTLTRIGALDTGGKGYTEWWYTGTFPTLYGMASPGAVVAINIDDKSYSTTADSSGFWSFFAPIDKGDYAFDITQGSARLAFKLHLGSALPAGLNADNPETTQSTAAVPDTGIDQLVPISFGFGVLLLATYLYFWGSNPKTASLQSTLKEF